MGISEILEIVDDGLIDAFIKDNKKCLTHLHYPYVDHMDFWKSYYQLPDEQKSHRCDLDSSWDPLFYLLTGVGSGSVDGNSISLDQKTKFYRVEWSGKRLTTCYGKIGSKGITDTKILSSSDEARDDAISKIEEKVMKGYKIVMEFTPLAKQDEKVEELKDEPKNDDSKKRKSRGDESSSKKVKSENNLNAITQKRLSEEIAVRGHTPKDNIVERLIQFALILNDEKSKSPLKYLLFGGTDLEDAQMSYGPVRALSSKQVQEFDMALKKVTEDVIKARYDPKKMEREAIGPPSFYDRVDETWDYLLLHFSSLKKFVDKAAQEGKGLLLYLS
jgi:predicted DNA-binding WGR domain protein